MTTEQGPFADSSIVDLGALQERVGGDMDLISEIVKIFFSCYPEAISRVRDAVVSENPKSLEAAAHNLRGYLVTFHAKRAAAAGAELETMGRSGDMTGAGEAFEKLEREIELLMPLLASLGPRIA
jgi:HPt (histidine-containing phosphotransfer) domain-containing protein